MQNKFINKLKHKFNILTGVPIEYDLTLYSKRVAEINKIDLCQKNDRFLKDLAKDLGERAKKGIELEKLLNEAFALVKETADRIIGLRPFDVQVLAGIVLHQRKLAEMQTGEGKTLAAVFPAFLNGLTGQGVHILTFNDYLARRDAAWMGPIFQFLGLTVGKIQEGMGSGERKKTYKTDITYATAKEAGFDFLRDQLCYDPTDQVQRPFHFAIIDEADSILIDEARVPLVIAGSTVKEDSDPYHLAELIKTILPELHYATDQGKRNIHLTDAGIKHIEESLKCGNLYKEENFDLLTRINCALHAEVLLKQDVDYIVRNEKIEIVDEFTGRVVKDRHWPDGLQEALEAKEKLIQQSSGEILGSISLQHFLALYPKICGMTATARNGAEELNNFYNLKVVLIPPNRPCIRKDHPDIIFSNKQAKTKALIDEIKENNSRKRPTLVGTLSVEESEQLSDKLRSAGIKCAILNAKNDEKEARIIAQAGAPGAVTISTNMAGRGTDIKLGGDQEQHKDLVKRLGGLYVIGTNRHESLRIDRQLRGRAGRQGDPGSSRFFISLEDDLIQRYGLHKRIPAAVQDPDRKNPISNPMVNREIIWGQRVVEGQNFEIRKTLRKYSKLIEMQRKIIQEWRRDILLEDNPMDILKNNVPNLYKKFLEVLGEIGTKNVEKRLTLFFIDKCWTQHLALIANIRESIHLVNVAGKTPLTEFQKQATNAFLDLKKDIPEEITNAAKSLKITSKKFNLDNEGIKGPSSTWTYLINDNQFDTWLEMFGGKNIGFAAGAALYAGPILMLWGILEKRKRKKKLD